MQSHGPRQNRPQLNARVLGTHRMRGNLSQLPVWLAINLVYWGATLGFCRADSIAQPLVPSDYWPSSVGTTLEYSGQAKFGGILVVREIVVRSQYLGVVELDGRNVEKTLEYTHVEARGRDIVESELFEYVVVDSLEMRTLAYESQSGELVRWPSESDYSLRAPLVAGATWVSVAPRMLHLAGSKVDLEFHSTLRVQRVGVQVDVPAGIFSNCIEVVASGKTSKPFTVIGLSGKQCDAYIEVSTQVWRSHDLGLVKQIVTSRARPVGHPDSTFSWDEYRLELVDVGTEK